MLGVVDVNVNVNEPLASASVRSITGRRPARSGSLRGIARVAIGLEIFLGLGALFGGGALIFGPDGHLLGMPVRLLAGSPFPSYLVPGIVLFTFVGVAPLVAAVLTVCRHAIAPFAAVAVGVTLIGWVAVEMVVLAGPGSLAWAFYLLLGASIAAVGVNWLLLSPSANTRA